jgi:hypothetical protein
VLLVQPENFFEGFVAVAQTPSELLVLETYLQIFVSPFQTLLN